jgi:O-6-methylguanine DNA methyltransferase
MYICEMHTPIGVLFIGEDENKIVYLSNKEPQEGQAKNTELLNLAKAQIEEYFTGARKVFELPLEPQGTPFQKAVWEVLAQIPYGETATYGQLAEKVSTKGASQAVGSAMRKNPIAIILPCHRVLPASGKLGNYSMGGPANKEWLLLLEAQNAQLVMDVSIP